MNTKTKATFSRLLQHPAWKRSGAILKEKIQKNLIRKENISKKKRKQVTRSKRKQVLGKDTYKQSNLQCLLGRIRPRRPHRVLPFWNRLQYHNSDFKILNRMNFSTLCTILVTFCPVTPEIVWVTTAPCWTIQQKSAYPTDISATTRPNFVSLLA